MPMSICCLLFIALAKSSVVRSIAVIHRSVTPESKLSINKNVIGVKVMH